MKCPATAQARLGVRSVKSIRHERGSPTFCREENASVRSLGGKAWIVLSLHAAACHCAQPTVSALRKSYGDQIVENLISAFA